MSAIIRDYGLYLEEFDQKKTKGVKVYGPSWDNWVLNEKDVRRLCAEIRYQIRRGKRPIVTVFEERLEDQ